MKTIKTGLKLVITLGIAIFMSSNLKSQTFVSGNGNATGIELPTESFLLSSTYFNGEKRNGFSNLEDIEGSPYASNNFNLGRIFFNDELFKDGLHLRYNQYGNEIEILIEGSSSENNYKALSRDIQYSVEITGKRYRFFPNVINNLGKQGVYLEELFIGEKYKLYVYDKVKFRPSVNSTSGYDTAQKAEFTNYTEFYFSVDDALVNKLPTKTKKVIQLFEKDVSELNNFIKKSKLRVGKSEDLIKIFNYLNSN